MKQTTDGIKTNFFRESIAFKTITGSCCNYCKTCHNKQQILCNNCFLRYYTYLFLLILKISQHCFKRMFSQAQTKFFNVYIP